ncbi:hypothetical protein EYR38_002028 [Pleurotus pulmonarius]|nr:hypothetical protein EYR38_002028 [Pleurotus pulmonarius]
MGTTAPTTPPRVNTVLNRNASHGYHLSRQLPLDAESLLQVVGSAVADMRKSVTYVPSVNLSPDLATTTNTNGFTQNPGAESMPASRRTSASSHDEELASQLQGLSFGGDRSNRASPVPGSISTSILAKGSSRFMDDEGARYANTYNAGMMLDEQLDQEMHNAMRHLPTSEEDKFGNSYPQQTSEALELAHISQATSPQVSYSSCYSPNGSTLDESMQYGVESMYGMNGGVYGRAISANSTKSGLVSGGGGADSKMGGLHGPKHKCGDIDREFNRFAGTRLEDLQGEIATMCKDQYGCRFLQRKLEEGVPEHRDMIFRETFNHFPELKTGKHA